MAAPVEAPHQFDALREFGTWKTNAVRQALQRGDFSYLKNWQVLGPGNLRSVAGPGLVGTLDAGTVNLGSYTLTLSALAGTPPFTAGDSVGGSLSGDPATRWNATVVSWDAVNSILVVANIISPDGILPTVAGRVYKAGPTFAGDIDTVTVTAPTANQLRVVKAWYVSMQNGDWVIALSNPEPPATVGALYAVSLNDGTFISFGTYDINDVVAWNSSVALLIGPSGFFSWDGTSSGFTNLSTGGIWTLLLSDMGARADFDVGATVDYVTSGPPAGLSSGTVLSWDRPSLTMTLTGPPPVLGSNIAEFSPTSTYSTIQAATFSAAPDNGNWIAVYAGRVWIAQGRAVTFSGPLDYTAPAWDVGNGSGTFLIPDTTLRGDITRLVVANGYLYIFGATSIDVVSNVYVPAGTFPPTPLFTRTNIDALNGTPFSYSIIALGRAILFYNRYGIHALLGAQVSRLSKDIDDTILQIDPDAPVTVSACVGISNNILSASFILSWFDPVAGGPARQTLITFSDGKFFPHDPFNDLAVGVSNTEDVLTFGVSCSIAGEPAAVVLRYGAFLDASHQTGLWRLFDDRSAVLDRAVQTALWSLGSSIHTKQALRYGVESNIDAPDSTLQAFVDSLGPVAPFENEPLDLDVEVEWYNKNLAAFEWVNEDQVDFIWINTGFQYAFASTNQYGKYLGQTVKGASGDCSISAFSLEYVRRDATWAL